MKEGSPAWKERISEKGAGSIDALIEKNPELELTSLAHTIEGKRRIFMLASPKELPLPMELAKTVLRYQSKEVINRQGDTNMFRTDCVFVAGNASKQLREKMPELGFEVISTRRYDGKEIPLFKEQGFGHHAVNVVEQNDGTYVAFDLSAHYTMDAEQDRYDVFGIMSDSREKLKKYLKDLSGSSWD